MQCSGTAIRLQVESCMSFIHSLEKILTDGLGHLKHEFVFTFEHM